jgi:hypothetical protein
MKYLDLNLMIIWLHFETSLEWNGDYLFDHLMEDCVNGFVIDTFSHYVVEKGFFARNREGGEGGQGRREGRKAALLLRRL